MEDQNQKLEALKKAYADIILNTSKETAARVMASEHKALRFHNDLCNTKDEALRMLVRFKQMVDLKTSEAKTTNLGQQRRIQEMDTQLNKTEGVIVNLRAELKKAHERLKEMKNIHMVQSNEPSKNEIANQENTAHGNMSDVTDPFNSSFQFGKCFNPSSESITSGFNLPSIIVGSKNPESYRNGYTHRIRAIESNLVDVKIISEDELAPPMNHTNIHEKGEKFTENSEDSACTLRRSIRKRKVRCWDQISSLFKSRAAFKRCKKFIGNDGVKVDDERKKLVSDLAVEKQEVVVKECVGTSSCNNSVTKADKAVKTDNVQGGFSDKNGVLKYTFSRNRKKVMPSNKCPSVEKTFLTCDNEKLGMIEDSSYDSQNLVEVACQLISLSGNQS